MKKFLLKFLLFSLPVLILLALFAVYDPFKVVRHHDDFYAGEVDSLPPFVTPNRDYVSSELYINNRDKYGYNSFIFGSSRTLAYDTRDWKKHLDTSAHPFLFDAMSENINGIFRKIEYIDNSGGQLKNCLILFDGDVTFHSNPENTGHLYVKHPAVAGDSWFPGADWLSFYSEFIKSYFDPDFLWNYYKFILTKKRAENFSDKWIVWSKFKFDLVTNDMLLSGLDEQINKDPETYYRERAGIFYERDSVKYSPPTINEEQIKLLEEMKAIFNKQGTNYKIVISPLYTQAKFNDEDV